ncbi:MAG: hypothetical protein HY040_00345 [Planctomycetes bacterium]|nr:hypothetical protein [Planctomycetota bacterium]
MASLLLPFLLAFLVPIALYLVILASLNRRHKPVLVSGWWDTLGLLFAASGFLLVVGPGLLVAFELKMAADLALEGKSISDFFRERWLFWALYYGAVFLGSALLLWWRQDTTIVYNVDTELFEGVLSETLESLNLHAKRLGRRLHLSPTPARRTEAPLDGAITATPNLLPATGLPATGIRPCLPELEVEQFPSMCNVSLHWARIEPAERSRIESALAKKAERARAFDNPAATWLMGTSGVLFGLIFLAVVILFLNAYVPPPRHW